MKVLIPVAAAFLTALLAGLLLFPVVYIVFDNFFHLYLFTSPPEDAWKDDLIITVTIILWLFISSAAGGFVCRNYSQENPALNVLLFVILLYIALFLFTKGDIIKEDVTVILIPVLSILAGGYTGLYLHYRFKKKKEIS